MIVTMTLWIVVVTLSCLLVGLQILTGVHIPQIMDKIYPAASGVLFAQAILFTIFYFLGRKNDRAS